jgi:uridine kinase
MTETKIFCGNDHTFYTVAKGSTLGELYERLPKKLPYPCVGAKANAHTVDLNYEIYNPQDVTFLDITSPAGMRVYVRTLCFVLCCAAAEICPESKVRIEHSVSHNYYVKLVGKTRPSDVVCRHLRDRMQELIDTDLPFHRIQAHTRDVCELFRSRGFDDKVALLETSGQLYATYYEMNNYVDFYYSSLLTSTGGLQVFDLIPFAEGMLLVVPQSANPTQLEPVVPQPKFMQALAEASAINDAAELQNVGFLNRAIEQGHVGDLILFNEAMQEKQLAKIAEQIAARPAVRMVLIAGPSSSGKTTTSRRLSVELMTCLKKPVALSMDNWFVNRADTPLDEFGEKDYESVYALDLTQFNRDLQDLIDGREIQLPTYNFQTGQREYSGKTLRLEPNTMLVIEGIHALNPVLTESIAEEHKFRVYASALTSISLDDHNWIPTTDNRLLRRIIRDYQYRGCSAAETIRRWASVRRGEEKWIFPFQEHADAIFNSAMIYEISAIRDMASTVLREVPHDLPEAAEAHRLLHFLDYFKPIRGQEIPPTSLLREFLGGSVFEL